MTVTDLARGPATSAAHMCSAPGNPLGTDHYLTDDLIGCVGADTFHPAAFDELRVFAESFEDAQRARIAIENRLRGAVVGDASLDALEALKHAEKKLGLAMRRSFRLATPAVAAWVKETTGVGEHLMARLLGCIGHPVIATPYHWEVQGGGDTKRILVADPPFRRNVAKLWAYCGHGDPTRRKAKGMTQDRALALGNPRAKMLVHLLAESAMKCVGTPIELPNPMEGSAADAPFSDDETIQDAPPIPGPSRRRSPYRDLYEFARINVADRDGWTPAHQHNHALRVTGKAILRDLWVVCQ